MAITTAEEMLAVEAATMGREAEHVEDAYLDNGRVGLVLYRVYSEGLTGANKTLVQLRLGTFVDGRVVSSIIVRSWWESGEAGP